MSYRKQVTSFSRSHIILGLLYFCLALVSNLAQSSAWAQSAVPITKPSDVINFDEDRAFKTLSAMVQRGQRYYGAPMREEAIQWLANQFKELGAELSLQRLQKLEPKSKVTYTLTNIVARFNPQAKKRVILGSHWDTRLWAEEDHQSELQEKPITGANDGSSGIAVLIELARQLPHLQLDQIGVDFVLFDGEEFGRPG